MKLRELFDASSVKLDLDASSDSGKIVIEAEEAGFSYGDQPILRPFSTTILRGDRVGVIGPNGSGKTTLLKLLLGELEPSNGKVRQGTRLQIAYFDQERIQLDPERSVRDQRARDLPGGHGPRRCSRRAGGRHQRRPDASVGPPPRRREPRDG